MWDLKHINVYALYSQEKKIMFCECGIINIFGLNTK